MLTDQFILLLVSERMMGEIVQSQHGIYMQK